MLSSESNTKINYINFACSPVIEKPNYSVITCAKIHARTHTDRITLVSSFNQHIREKITNNSLRFTFENRIALSAQLNEESLIAYANGWLLSNF